MQNNYSNENYAGFWVRLAAYAIDSVIVGIGLLIFRLILAGVMWILDGTWLGGNVLFHYTLKDIVLYLLKILYFVLLTYYTGTTLGKKLMNLRVVPVNREEKLTFIDVLFRESVGRFLSGLILWIGYIMIGIDKEKRGLHDILCDTHVVYEKKIKVYAQPQVAQAPNQPMPPAQPQMQKPMTSEQQCLKSVQETVKSMSEEKTGAVSSEDLIPESMRKTEDMIPRQVQPAPKFRQAPPQGGYQFVRPGSQLTDEQKKMPENPVSEQETDTSETESSLTDTNSN